MLLLYTHNILGCVGLVLPLFEQHGEIFPVLNIDLFDRPLLKDLSLVNLGETLSRFGSFGLTARAGSILSESCAPSCFDL